jgi:Acetylornithine deacetylase/Succinyl-diaminopimelate desuccinylase and related deacylases
MENNWKRVEEEVTDILRSLIRINTTNPPGNETLAATFIKDLLEREGITAAIYESAPGRGNLVARLPGNGNHRPIILLAHMDVVPANPAHWSYDPFAGTIADEYIWGRGALDMKGMLAMELMALILSKRSGQVPDRELILIATADEEVGGVYGIEWLLKQEIPGLNIAEYVINEGGEGTLREGIPVYTCQNGEKGLLWVKLSIGGTPGHASMPSKDNAILQMNKILSRISRFQSPLSLCNTTRQFLSQMAIQKGIKLPTSPATLDYTLKMFANRYFSQERSIQAMLRNTISPTILRAGAKTNVLPELCELTLDCRLVPGETPEQFLDRLKNLINDSNVTMEVVQAASATESPLDTELYKVISQAVQEKNANGYTVPYLSALATDSRYFRAKGITSYGFIPVLISETELQRMHGIDERLSLANLTAGTQILFKVIQEICHFESGA